MPCAEKGSILDLILLKFLIIFNKCPPHFALSPINYVATPHPSLQVFSGVPSASCQEPGPYIFLHRQKGVPSIADVPRRRQGLSPKALKENTQVLLQGQFATERGTDSKMKPEPRTKEMEI